jgi:hypothetical protein
MPNGAGHSNSGGGEPGGLRCVLWHAPGAALPDDLLTSLSRRIAHITVCTDSFAAMAEVCALEARRQSQHPAGPQGTVLLIVHPAMLADAPEVVTELRTYAPGALAWKYDAGANPRLSAVVESDVAKWATGTTRATGGGAAAAAGADSSARTHDSNLSSSVTVTATHGGSSPLTPASTPRPTPSGPSGASQPPARHATPLPSPSPAPENPARGGVFASNAGPPRLRLTDAPPPVRDANPRGLEVTVRPSASRGLQLRGVGEGAPSALPPPPRPALTPEEMRMLLGEDPHDPGGPDHGHNGHGGRGDPSI